MRLDDDDRAIQCLWEKVSLSAHAPTRDLHAFAERMTRGRERTAFCVVHGEPAAQRELASWISDSLRDEGATGAQPPATDALGSGPALTHGASDLTYDRASSASASVAGHDPDASRNPRMCSTSITMPFATTVGSLVW